MVAPVSGYGLQALGGGGFRAIEAHQHSRIQVWKGAGGAGKPLLQGPGLSCKLADAFSPMLGYGAGIDIVC